MSKKHRKRTSRTARKRYRKSSYLKFNDPLVWLGGALLVIVLLVVVGIWKSNRPLAASIEPSQAEDTTSLLPLAQKVRPLQGGHDMALIPQQPPQPKPAPADALVPQLELPSTDYDFGSIPKRPDVAHVFAVQNVGDANLELSNLVDDRMAGNFRALSIAPVSTRDKKIKIENKD